MMSMIYMTPLCQNLQILKSIGIQIKKFIRRIRNVINFQKKKPFKIKTETKMIEVAHFLAAYRIVGICVDTQLKGTAILFKNFCAPLNIKNRLLRPH